MSLDLKLETFESYLSPLTKRLYYTITKDRTKRAARIWSMTRLLGYLKSQRWRCVDYDQWSEQSITDGRHIGRSVLFPVIFKRSWSLRLTWDQVNFIYIDINQWIVFIKDINSRRCSSIRQKAYSKYSDTFFHNIPYYYHVLSYFNFHEKYLLILLAESSLLQMDNIYI